MASLESQQVVGRHRRAARARSGASRGKTSCPVAGLISLALAQAGLLVHWLYGIPLPEPLVALIANEKRSVSLAAKAVDAMLLSEEEQFALPARIKYRLYLLRIRERLPGHVALSSSMVSIDVFKECPLPDGLFWLYLPLRPSLWFIITVSSARKNLSEHSKSDVCPVDFGFAFWTSRRCSCAQAWK